MECCRIAVRRRFVLLFSCHFLFLGGFAVPDLHPRGAVSSMIYHIRNDKFCCLLLHDTALSYDFLCT